jgi:hypothetical protein
VLSRMGGRRDAAAAEAVAPDATVGSPTGQVMAPSGTTGHPSAEHSASASAMAAGEEGASSTANPLVPNTA